MHSTQFTDTSGEPSRWGVLIFALPALPIAMMHIPVGAVIPGFYAKHTATTLTSIGVVFLVSRIFDAVIDPTIGYLSDRSGSRVTASAISRLDRKAATT